MVFNTFTMLYTYHLYLVPKIFITSKGNRVPIKHSALILPTPNPWQLPICLLFLWVYLFSIFHMNGIIQCVAFCIWGTLSPLLWDTHKNPRSIIRNHGLGLLLTVMLVSRAHSFNIEHFLFVSLFCGFFHSAFHPLMLMPKTVRVYNSLSRLSFPRHSLPH